MLATSKHVFKIKTCRDLLKNREIQKYYEPKKVVMLDFFLNRASN